MPGRSTPGGCRSPGLGVVAKFQHLHVFSTNRLLAARKVILSLAVSSLITLALPRSCACWYWISDFLRVHLGFCARTACPRDTVKVTAQLVLLAISAAGFTALFVADHFVLVGVNRAAAACYLASVHYCFVVSVVP